MDPPAARESEKAPPRNPPEDLLLERLPRGRVAGPKRGGNQYLDLDRPRHREAGTEPEAKVVTAG